MKAVKAICAILAVSISSPSVGQPSCGVDAGFTLPDNGGAIRRPVRRLSEALVFTSGMRVNTDGAANSYHPIGTSRGALNTICNGIAVIPRTGPWASRRITSKAPEALSSNDRCQMILDIFRRSRDANYAILPDASIDWYALAMQAPTSTHYRPCIQQSGSYAGFFVAQTARAANPDIDDVCNTARWISSTEIPYITLPGNRLAAHGVRTGDLALVHRRANGIDQIVVAVAGDTGNMNELGEGSIALHHKLGNPTRDRIPGNISGGVTTFVFPGRPASRPISDRSLEAELDDLLMRLGGRSAVIACGRETGNQ